MYHSQRLIKHYTLTSLNSTEAEPGAATEGCERNLCVHKLHTCSRTVIQLNTFSFSRWTVFFKIAPSQLIKQLKNMNAHLWIFLRSGPSSSAAASVFSCSSGSNLCVVLMRMQEAWMMWLLRRRQLKTNSIWHMVPININNHKLWRVFIPVHWWKEILCLISFTDSFST